MRRHRLFLLACGLLGALLIVLVLHARWAVRDAQPQVAANRALVSALALTDLSLWTEARYTRHPSQTDFFSPFQDLPGGEEHFPAGSILAVPPHLEDVGGGR